MKDRKFDEDKLIKGLLGGSDKELRRFYKLYATRLKGYIFSRVGADEDAEEIFQDTLLSALDSLALFSRRSSLFSWLCAIAKHEIADYYRKKKIKGVVFFRLPKVEEFVSKALEPDALLLRKEYEKQIKSILGKLLPKYKKVLELKYMDELSVSEVAEKMGLSYKACESLLTRARQAFILSYEEHN